MSPNFLKRQRLREEQKAWEDEQVLRTLDSIATDGVGRYALVRSSKKVAKPYAAIYLGPKENPAEVADKLGAQILELTGDARPETAERLEADRDWLNTVFEVMES